VAEQLLARHGFGVDEVGLEWDLHFVVALLEDFPDGGFATARRPHQHNPHPLLGGFIELKYFGHLRFVVGQFHFL
jgi:hypothetical protein